MISKRTWLTVTLAAVFLITAGCTNDGLDDGTSADVIIQVMAMDNRPVSANQTTAAQGTCSSSGVLCDSNAQCADTETCVRASICLFEVEQWSATLQVTPKNSLATAPFNDVIMENVRISYDWPDTGLSTPTRTLGLTGSTIPAEGSNQIMFFPILGQDLASLDQGITGQLEMTFFGRTVEGTLVSGTAHSELYIETCN